MPVAQPLGRLRPSDYLKDVEGLDCLTISTGGRSSANEESPNRNRLGSPARGNCLGSTGGRGGTWKQLHEQQPDLSQPWRGFGCLWYGPDWFGGRLEDEGKAPELTPGPSIHPHAAPLRLWLCGCLLPESFDSFPRVNWSHYQQKLSSAPTVGSPTCFQSEASIDDCIP